MSKLRRCAGRDAWARSRARKVLGLPDMDAATAVASDAGGRLVMYLLGVLFVAFGIGASIALHEIGHLAPAKRFSGVKVTQYMVGFGPTLWSRHRGETEYGVSVILRCIRMIGMFPPRPGDDPGTLRVSSTGRSRSSWTRPARRASRRSGRATTDGSSTSCPAQEGDAGWRRLVMNLIIAVVLFGGIFTLYGLPEVTTKLSSVSECVDVKQAGQSTAAECTPDMPVTRPTRPGSGLGDVLTSVAGTPVSIWDDVRVAIRGNLDKPMTIEPTRPARRSPCRLGRWSSTCRSTTGWAGRRPTTPARSYREGRLPRHQRHPEIVQQPVSPAPGPIWEQVSRTAGVVR